MAVITLNRSNGDLRRANAIRLPELASLEDVHARPVVVPDAERGLDLPYRKRRSGVRSVVRHRLRVPPRQPRSRTARQTTGDATGR